MIEDSDVELLEELLDNELNAQQREQVSARLVREPKLAAELEHLRGERKLRWEMFSSLEGGEEAVVEKVLAAVTPAGLNRAAVMSGRAGPTRRLRYAMAAAALIAIGFVVGWMGATGGTSNVVANEPPYRVEIVDESGQVMAVQKFQSLQKAMEFSIDLQQWQIRQERLLNGEVPVHSAKY